MRETSCFFTGHRQMEPGDLPALSRLLEEKILELHAARNVTDFYSGGAMGFDMLAAEAVLSRKDEAPGLRLVLALPCPDHTARWHERDKRRFAALLKRADRAVFLSPFYTPDCMHVRNRYLAEQARYGISYLRRARGGTFYTVNYAVSIGCTVCNLADALGPEPAPAGP